MAFNLSMLNVYTVWYVFMQNGWQCQECGKTLTSKRNYDDHKVCI